MDSVAANKANKHLQKNLDPYIRKEYNRFRVHIGGLLSDAAVLRVDDEDPATLLSRDAIRVEIADSHRFSHQIVDSPTR